MSSNLKIKLHEASQKDPEWDKYLHDVKVFIGKHYIKNIMEWVRKRGNTIKDEEGNQFINMVASCYDEDMRVANAAKLLSDWVTTNDWQHTEWDDDPKSPLERQIMLFDSPTESKKNEKSYYLDAADRKFLQGHTINNAQLNAFEREFPKLKFKDTFFPKNPTYRATPDEIPLTAEDAETMIGSREDFLLMCLDALRSTRSVERVKSAEGEDVITAYT